MARRDPIDRALAEVERLTELVLDHQAEAAEQSPEDSPRQGRREEGPPMSRGRQEFRDALARYRRQGLSIREAQRAAERELIWEPKRREREKDQRESQTHEEEPVNITEARRKVRRQRKQKAQELKERGLDGRDPEFYERLGIDRDTARTLAGKPTEDR